MRPYPIAWEEGVNGNSQKMTIDGRRTVMDLRVSVIVEALAAFPLPGVYFFARLATAAASSGFSMANHSALYRPGSALAFTASVSSFFTVSGFM